MKIDFPRRRAPMVLVLLTIAILAAPARGQDDVSFARDVRPILATKCFACHGPDDSTREADLRLDDRDSAIDLGAIVPGDPDASELIFRIESDDPDDQMPPPEAHEQLTDQERATLRAWVSAGAEYQPHWAFVPPQRPAIPRSTFDGRAQNAIDRFVFRRLEQEGLAPAAEADRYELIRRVYLDLIGLPPTPAEADAFAHNQDPAAYEKIVDRLLASPRYGEHWARRWLDLARYSDTNGYEKDRPRSIWPYRDWVIQNLNADLPYDQFSIEQLAGDMLPNATESQRIATGFHRNSMLNEEGGIDPLEFRFYAMVDRVATTGIVWMGLTTGCAQCHSHKYDPITHTDYYRLMALMNNADEPDLYVSDSTNATRQADLLAQIEAIERDLPQQFPPASGSNDTPEARLAHFETRFQNWMNEAHAVAHEWTVLRPQAMKTNMPRLELLEDGSILSQGDITKRDVFELTFDVGSEQLPVTALRLEALPDDRLPEGGPGRAYYEGRKGDFFLSELQTAWNDQPVAMQSASHSYGKISIGNGTAEASNVIDGEGSTGWSTAQREGEAHQLVVQLAEPIDQAGQLKLTMIFERHFAASLGRFRISATSASGEIKASPLPVEVEAMLVHDPSSLTGTDSETLRRYFASIAPELEEARKRIVQLRKRLPAETTTMVMQEWPAGHRRPTYRHHRGEYLNPREEVTPGLPEFFAGDEERQPGNRLELARWLVSDRNPLAARVAVNRAWQEFFGTGIVPTSGDFGRPTDPPSHPDLIDWLATELVASNWSMKEIHRLIVTSATYRQSSHMTLDSWQRDPANRLLARGPRFRISGESIRDIMLGSSGLLSTKMYGPGVRPPQPASVTRIAYGNVQWKPSEGTDRYRRSVYTFSKRTAPFAAYMAFDGTSGESCMTRRRTSNNALQSLTLLNDEMFLEMARALARDVERQQIELGQTDPPSMAAAIFRRLLTRKPEPAEISDVIAYWDSQQKRLETGELNTAQIATDENATADQAAWMLVARALMNLDEVITKP